MEGGGVYSPSSQWGSAEFTLPTQDGGPRSLLSKLKMGVGGVYADNSGWWSADFTLPKSAVELFREPKSVLFTEVKLNN